MRAALPPDHPRGEWIAPAPLLSTLALIAANLIPLYGVLILGWNVFAIMCLYWLENLTIGFFNILRMVAAAQPRSGVEWRRALVHPALFMVHYGMACLIYGLFVVFLFAGDLMPGPEDTDPPGDAGQALLVFAGRLFTPSSCYLGVQILKGFSGLVLSHGISFVVNFIGRGEFRRVSPGELEWRPYGRVLVLHVALLVGGPIVMITGAYAMGVAVLVLVKIGLDVRLHWNERTRFIRKHEPTE